MVTVMVQEGPPLLSDGRRGRRWSVLEDKAVGVGVVNVTVKFTDKAAGREGGDDRQRGGKEKNISCGRLELARPDAVGRFVFSMKFTFKPSNRYCPLCSESFVDGARWNYTDPDCSLPYVDADGVITCSCNKPGAFALVWSDEAEKVTNSNSFIHI